MAVTIRQVAKRLHLSITTVSRALDGYGDVAAKTRQRVIRTAREMGYVPSRAARQLRRQRADTIGYIIPGRPPYFTDPFSSEFIAGLGDGSINLFKGGLTLQDGTAYVASGTMPTDQQIWYLPQLLQGMSGQSK